jgi:hypothetical protein
MLSPTTDEDSSTSGAAPRLRKGSRPDKVFITDSRDEFHGLPAVVITGVHDDLIAVRLVLQQHKIPDD